MRIIARKDLQMKHETGFTCLDSGVATLYVQATTRHL